MITPETESGQTQAIARRPPRRKLSFWRSPEDQPYWARPALLCIASIAAVLYAWNIASAQPPTLYLAAVRSMSESWKAFFYGAMDPGATITVDKIPGSFIPQALSARIFGFHMWSVTLPQVIEGIVAVLVMYRVVRRWQGPVAGILASALFALTPILSAMFGQTMEDSLLVMCLVLAADAFVRALPQARLGALALTAVWVGIGFQAKMLDAWLVVPAFAITYLAVAPGGWRRRLGQLSAAGAVLLAVSLSWMILVAVTPGHDRPYVDGSTDNSAFPMVFGYNGFDRFSIHVPGAAHPLVGSQGHPGPGGHRGPPPGQSGQSGPGQSGPGQSGRPAGQNLPGPPVAEGGTVPQGWTKLFSGMFGTQVGWLYPLALLALVLGLVRARRAPRTDPRRGGFIMWGLWLAAFGVMYSEMSLPHTAYVAVLAPPVAALAAVGMVLTWTAYRDGTARWALPAAIAAQVAWSGYLSSQYPHFLPWLTWIVLAVAIVSLAVLTAATLTGRIGRAVLLGGMAAGIAAMTTTPAIWSASVLDPPYRGSSFDASAGPGGQHLVDHDFQPSGSLLGYLSAHQDGARFVAATDSWGTADSYIVTTGRTFMPIGGFTGALPHPTVTEFQQLIRDGQLRYYLLGPYGGLNVALDMGEPGTSAGAILGWVRTRCVLVPPADYGGTPATGTLYDCKPGS
jgi:4-amino-4-deoxy-L-arabinose transferase-like glycosyltransferase